MQISGYKIGYGHTTKDIEVKDAEKVIRTLKAYDFERIMPVVGELTAKQLGLEATPEMSNYITDWLMTGAVSNRSDEALEFEKAMRNNPAIADRLIEARETAQEELNMTPLQLMKTGIKSENTQKSFRQFLGETKESFFENWIDDLYSVKRLVENIEKTSGQKVPESINAYLEARMYKGTDGVVYKCMVDVRNEDAAIAVWTQY